MRLKQHCLNVHCSAMQYHEREREREREKDAGVSKVL